MSRNSHNPRGSSTYARNQTSRWRGIILMLVLTFSIGSLGQPVQAQEADPDVKVGTRIEASLPQKICVYEIGDVKIRVIRSLVSMEKKTGDITASSFTMNRDRMGIKINATSGDSDIASLLQTTMVTGMNEEIGGYAQFDYRGEKAGTTNLNFETDKVSSMPGETLDGASPFTGTFEISVPVTIEDCKFKVHVDSHWESTGGQVTGKVNAVIEDTDLLPTSSEGTYRADAKVKWSGTGSKLRDCGSEFSGESNAEIVGTMNNIGMLHVTVQYQPVQLQMDAKCKNSEGEALGGMEFPSTASSIYIDVDASTGGGSTSRQTLSTLYEMPGFAFIQVWQEK